MNIKNRTFKLAYVVSHPIQYQAPLLKKISAQDDIDLNVIFLCNLSTERYQDNGFNQDVKWDTPLLEGYEYNFVKSIFKSGDFSINNPKVDIRSLKNALDTHQWDAVWIHGYGNLALLYTVYYCWKNNISLMLRGESNLVCSKPGLLKTLFLKFLFKQCNALLTIGEDNRQYYLAHDAELNKLFHMPYAVDNEHFRRSENDSIDLHNKKRIVLYASKFIKRKNPLMLIKAYHRLPSKVRQQSELWLVGNGEQYQAMQNYVTENNLENSVIFHGFKNQTELPDYFRACDVFVLPSEREPFGLVINEVMNQGKAIITTDEVGAARDLVKNNKNGWVIEAGLEDALYNALFDALTCNEEKLISMGKQSLKKISGWSFDQDIHGLREALVAVCK